MAFQRDELVILKSGGPVMTVEEVFTDSVCASWFHGTELKTRLFRAGMLRSAEAPTEKQP